MNSYTPYERNELYIILTIDIFAKLKTNKTIVISKTFNTFVQVHFNTLEVELT